VEGKESHTVLKKYVCVINSRNLNYNFDSKETAKVGGRILNIKGKDIPLGVSSLPITVSSSLYVISVPCLKSDM